MSNAENVTECVAPQELFEGLVKTAPHPWATHVYITSELETLGNAFINVDAALSLIAEIEG